MEIRAVEVTSGNVGDAPMLPDLLAQIPGEEEIGSVAQIPRGIHLVNPSRQLCIMSSAAPPTIWFDPEMSWDATPSGRLGRQQTYGSAAIPACLALKILFSMVPRQTTGVVESLLRLVGPDWTVPGFGTRSRRQESLAATIPCRGSKGPLHLLIDSTGSRSRVKASGTL